MKKCSKCKKSKPLNKFPKNKAYKCGYNAQCKVCKHKYDLDWARNNREKSIKYCENYRNNYKIKFAEIKKRYKQNNKEKVNAENRKWKKDNKNKINYLNAKRRAGKLQRTPKWANLDKIKEIYLNCPKGYHVDHIIPLKGLNISGLHVENNFQYLPAIENLKKGNRVYIK